MKRLVHFFGFPVDITSSQPSRSKKFDPSEDPNKNTAQLLCQHQV